MARKLKHDNLPAITRLNLHPAADTNDPLVMGASPTRRYKTRDVLSFMSEGEPGHQVGMPLELEHRSAMVLARLMAQRIITESGWVHGDQLCVQSDGTQAAKAIYHMRAAIISVAHVRLPIESNKLGSYRLALDPDAISFTVTDLAQCDDAQVVALIETVKMKRPEAVNGDNAHEANAV